MYATATAEPVHKYYPDVRDALYAMDQELDQLRNEWEHTTGIERDDIERKAYAITEARTRKQFRLNRHEDEIIQEPYSLVNDFTNYDSNMPQTDSEWLAWKVDKFIKNIAHRTSKGHLYIGSVLVRPVSDEGYFEFRCYKRGCAFHAKHYVGSDRSRIELRIGRIMAHWYKHA